MFCNENHFSSGRCRFYIPHNTDNFIVLGQSKEECAKAYGSDAGSASRLGIKGTKQEGRPKQGDYLSGY